MRQAEKNLRHVIRETLLLLEVTESAFTSLVLGTDITRAAGNEKESNLRKTKIAGLIRAAADRRSAGEAVDPWATLPNLAKIIVDNDLYQIKQSSPGIVRDIWGDFLDAEKILALQREISRLLPGAEYREPRRSEREPSSERSSPIDAAVVFENLEKIRKIQSAVYWAVNKLAGKQIMIPRSSGLPNLADFICFNPSRKEIFVRWKVGESDAEKILKSFEVVNLNRMDVNLNKPLTILSEFDPERTFLSYGNQAAIVNKIDQFHFGPSVTSTATLDVLDTSYSDLIIDGYSYYDGRTGKRTELKGQVKIKSFSEIEILELVRQNPWLADRPRTSY